MKLWIIGNGFDLHHGLKTRYADYKAFLCRRHACDRMKEQRKSLSQESCCAVCGCCCKHAIKTKCPVKKFNELPRAELKEDLWRDLEEACEIDLIKFVDLLSGKWAWNGSPVEKFAATSCSYDKLQFAQVFTGSEFYDWLRKVESSLYDIKDRRLAIDEGDLFLTFNYTRTLHEIYCIPESADRVFYVHGRMADVAKRLEETAPECRGVEENGIVHSEVLFGSPKITDAKVQAAVEHYKETKESCKEAEDELAKCLKQLSDSLKKDVQGRLAKMKNWLSKHCGMPSLVEEVIVAGHSLGEYDMPYFIFLAELFRYTKWQFIFYSEDDLGKARAFCSRHKLAGYYMPWDTASFDCDQCPADRIADCATDCALAQ